MFITTVIAAGYLLYLERKLSKEEEMLAARLTKKQKSTAVTNSTITPQKVIEQLLNPFEQKKRNQQLQSIELREKSIAEQEVDEKIKISSGLLGIAIVGSLVAAPLTYVAIAGLAWMQKDFFKTAYQKSQKGKIGIEVLDSIAIIGTLGLGYAVLGGVGTVLYFGSKKLLIKTEDHASQKLVNIFGEQPKQVWIVVDNVEVQIPFEQLKKGSIVSIHTGNMIPIDGEIVHGYALIDQRALTGESQPIEKKIGDTCFASTMILEGYIHVRVEKTGSETVMAQIGTMLNNTLDFKDEMISKGERLADESTLPLLTIGTLSMPFVGLVGGTAIYNASFGYSLRMVSPVLMLNFLTAASNKGILIKDGRSLELLNQIDTIVFDKTGTLTLNQPCVANIHTWGDLSEDQLLRYAAAAEYKQSHPIALAIIQAATAKELIIPTIQEAKYEVGYGIKVSIGNKQIYVGSARFMDMEGIIIPNTVHSFIEEGRQNGYSFVYVGINKQLVGTIELHPTIRPEAKQIVQALKRQGKSCYIISGDHLWPTAHLARQLGIENYFAEVLPEEKSNLVAMLQKEGRKVCFVGDGINDSIALKKADVSISLRGASTIATDTAHIILMNENLEKLPFIFELGHQFDKHMSNNIWSSLLPSAVTIGGALFFHFGIATAIVMNQVGLIVGIGNSMQPLLTMAEEEEEEPIVFSKESIEIEPVVEKEEQREFNNEIRSISDEPTANYELINHT